MKIESELYKSATCNAATLAELVDDIPEQAAPMAAYGAVGYYAIDGHLVPYSFIDRLADHLVDFVFDYDVVLSPREMVGDEFWEDLDQAEREILVPCLLLLVERGQFPVVFHAEEGVTA